jgi:hypothetical protein
MAGGGAANLAGEWLSGAGGSAFGSAGALAVWGAATGAVSGLPGTLSGAGGSGGVGSGLGGNGGPGLVLVEW